MGIKRDCSLLRDILKVLAFSKIGLQTCDQIHLEKFMKKGVMKFFYVTIVEIKKARW